MSSLNDLSGKTFRKWTVMRGTMARYGGRLRHLWDCRCECGTERAVANDALVSGKSTQCRDCGNREKATLKSRLVHGGSGTRLHNIWMLMHRRCGDAKHPDFKRYGGRGISVCREWKNFTAFHEWASVNGYAAGLTLDRIDNDRGYRPDNCRWVSRTTQNRNRGNNIRYEWKGQMLILSEISERECVRLTMLRQRVQKRGWPIEAAVTLPSGTRFTGERK